MSFLMVSVSAHLIAQSEGQSVGINDLKSRFRGLKYAVETIKIVLEKADGLIWRRLWNKSKRESAQ
jgi:hypothetical protein